MRISDWSSDVCSSDLKALLAEAGFPNGVTIKAIHTTLPGMLATIEATQALLKDAGINLEITTVEHATFHAQIRQDLSQVVYYTAARFPIADVYRTQFFHSDSTVGKPPAVTNFPTCDVADAQIWTRKRAGGGEGGS